MKDVIALVTGGASGMGEATVKMIVSNGGKAVIADINPQGHALANELGKNVLFHQTDVTSEDSVDEAIKFTKDNFGKLNVVVNCAGIFGLGKIYDFDNNTPQSLDNCKKFFEVNTFGTINVMARSIGLMKDNQPDEGGQRGVIINIGSVAGFSAGPGLFAYGASKAAVHSLTESTARHVACLGIRVVGIAPGLTDTPMMNILPSQIRDVVTDNMLFPRRLGQPDDITHCIKFIIENKFINAEIIRLDGGFRSSNK
ncbi:3-hydroxyacyl-CoA dehydrogenase type-2-like [Aphidius gifuensis]|nr:3-hydroxyacyl-CoA dehydrogenase type-2-like [Aphidius gifuensis]